MSDDPESRESLKMRQLPEMVLSTADNPLTAPRLPPEGLSAAQRAQHRFSVKGNVIVTGGAGTLALEAASALLEHGASGLALWDLSPDQALPAITALHKKFPDRRIITEAVDVRDEAQIASAIIDTVKVLGSVDILCCFAGVVGCEPALDMSAANWRRTHDINLTGSFLCAQAFARQIQTQGTGGSIVFTASISAHHTNFPQPQAAYNSSKTALLSLTKSLAAEWAALGIRVNALSPGYMDTILNEGEGLERARKEWNRRNPMGRMGVPWELTGPLVMLVSEAGRYVNGTDVIVDGGAMVF
ncbi:NAD(P)-binding protein [Bimuria novae-zelandiae CBS 107.79]|uniref:D-arabinitol 2-dehydrogenase [ribulose-forming] n=1 Tax=Bimuria novae-zelandiae CBS 107.79 TaxID=1447943 RepID=A0A6A5VKE0_9PLEO|nr:NAD(P)-binding protein [Bimuria novae-zelandiae CBS 107.79]